MPRNAVNPLAARLVKTASTDPTRLGINALFFSAELGYWFSTNGHALFATSLLPPAPATGGYKPKPFLDGDTVPWPEAGEWVLESIRRDAPESKFQSGEPQCLTRIPTSASTYKFRVPEWVSALKYGYRHEQIPVFAVRRQPQLESFAKGNEKTILDPIQLSSNLFRFEHEKHDPYRLNLALVSYLAGEEWYIHLEGGAEMAWLTATPERDLWKCPAWLLLTSTTAPGAGHWLFEEAHCGGLAVPTTVEKHP